MPSLKLIGHALCPYVQRVVIVLQLKRLEYDVEYIELDPLPGWFLAIAPMGRVPVLQADDVILHESHVIMNYLNDIGVGDLHPGDALTRARQSSLMEFASDMLEVQWEWSMARTKEEYERLLKTMIGQINFTEQQLQGSPFFNGSELSMIDASFAPLLQRLFFNERDHNPGLFDCAPKTKAWTEALLSVPQIRSSVAEHTDRLIEADMRQGGSFLATL